MGFLRRRQGLGALAPLVDKMDDDVLAAGMRAAIVEKGTADEILMAMEESLQSLRAEIHRRHWMVSAGVLAIQEGWDSEDIVAEVRAVAAE